MADYLLQEDGFKISLEDGTGFLILDDTPILVRVTQVPTDVAISEDPDARITQIPVDVVFAEDSDARVTQIPVDVIFEGESDFRLTQIPVDVIIQNVNESVQIILIELSPKEP